MVQGTPEYDQFILKEVLAQPNWILFPQYLHSYKISAKTSEKLYWTQGEMLKVAKENTTDVKE